MKKFKDILEAKLARAKRISGSGSIDPETKKAIIGKAYRAMMQRGMKSLTGDAVKPSFGNIKGNVAMLMALRDK